MNKSADVEVWWVRVLTAPDDARFLPSRLDRWSLCCQRLQCSVRCLGAGSCLRSGRFGSFISKRMRRLNEAPDDPHAHQSPGGAEGCKAGKIGVQCKWGKIALGTRSAVYFQDFGRSTKLDRKNDAVNLEWREQHRGNECRALPFRSGHNPPSMSLAQRTASMITPNPKAPIF